MDSQYDRERNLWDNNDDYRPNVGFIGLLRAIQMIARKAQGSDMGMRHQDRTKHTIYKLHLGKKRVAQILCVSLAVALAGVITSTSTISVIAASDVFADLASARDKLISNKASFQIAEIADDDEEASLGYLVAGQEPFRQFTTITKETETNGDLDPTDSLGSVVTQLQENGIVGETSGNDLTPKHPLYYELTPYDGTAPYDSSTADKTLAYNAFCTNTAKGLAGRDLVHGWYVPSDSGRYVREDVSDEIAMNGQGSKLAGIYLDPKGEATVVLPSSAENANYIYTWSSDNEEVATIAQTSDSAYKAVVTAVLNGRTYVTCKVTDADKNVIGYYYCIVAVGEAVERGITAEFADATLRFAQGETKELDATNSEQVNVTVTGLSKATLLYHWTVQDETVAKLYDPATVETAPSSADSKDLSDDIDTGESPKIGIYAVSSKEGASTTMTLTVTTSYNGITYTATATCELVIDTDGLFFNPGSLTLVNDSASDINSLSADLTLTSGLKTGLTEGSGIAWTVSKLDTDGAAVTDADTYLSVTDSSSNAVDVDSTFKDLSEENETKTLALKFTAKTDADISDEKVFVYKVSCSYTPKDATESVTVSATCTVTIADEDYTYLTITAGSTSDIYVGDTVSYSPALTSPGGYTLTNIEWKVTKPDNEKEESSTQGTTALDYMFSDEGNYLIEIVSYTCSKTQGSETKVLTIGDEEDDLPDPITVKVNAVTLAVSFTDTGTAEWNENSNEFITKTTGEYTLSIVTSKDGSKLIGDDEAGSITFSVTVDNTSSDITTMSVENSSEGLSVTYVASSYTTDEGETKFKGDITVTYTPSEDKDTSYSLQFYVKYGSPSLSGLTNSMMRSSKSAATASTSAPSSTASTSGSSASSSASTAEPNDPGTSVSKDSSGESTTQNDGEDDENKNAAAEKDTIEVPIPDAMVPEGGDIPGDDSGEKSGEGTSDNSGEGSARIAAPYTQKTLKVQLACVKKDFLTALGIQPITALAEETEEENAEEKAEESGNMVMSFYEDNTLIDTTSMTTYTFTTTEPSDLTNAIEGYGYATYTLYNNEWLKEYVFGLEDTSSKETMNISVNVVDMAQANKNDQSIKDYIIEKAAEPDLIYISADGIAQDQIVCDLDGAPQDSEIQDMDTDNAKRLLRYCNHYQSTKLETYGINAAAIVNYDLYSKRDTSNMASDQPNLYLMGLTLMSEEKEDRIDDAENLYSNTAASIAEVTEENGKGKLFSRGNYAVGNVFVASYDSGHFKESYGADTKEKLPLVNLDFNSAYTQSEYTAGFASVYQFIIEENLRRSSSGKSSMSTEFISPALVIQYILLYYATDDLIYKTSIKVLELEPCYAFKYYDADPDSASSETNQLLRTEAFAESFAPQFAKYSHDTSVLEGLANQITITGMSTAQFVGSIEDICEEYDIIYIGTQGVGTTIEQTTGMVNGEKKDIVNIVDNPGDPLMNVATGTASGIKCSGPTDISVTVGDVYWNGLGWYKNVTKKGVTTAKATTLTQSTSVISYGVEYDWYYDGSSGYWYRPKYETLYNTSGMNGIVYAHTGDTVRDTQNYDQNVTYSGNDILTNQENQLINFLKLGYPIIVDNDFLTYDNGVVNTAPTGISAGSGKMKAQDGTSYAGTLDTNSNLYALLGTVYNVGNGWSKRTYENLVTDYEARVSGIEDYLNQSKLTINLTSQPMPYTAIMQGTDGNDQYILDPDSCEYLQADADGSYYLDFEFNVTDVANVTPLSTTYTVSLYLDNNSDGRFTGSTDDGKGSVKRTETEQIALTSSNVTNSSSGSVDPSAIYAYTTYHVRRQLPEGYVGSIPWKIKVTQNGTNKAGVSSHDSVIGMTAVIPKDGEKIEIDILQITTDFSVAYGESKSAQALADLGNNDLQFQMKYKTGGYWEEMLNNVPGYDINIVSITNVDFADSYIKGKKNADGDVILSGKELTYSSATNTYAWSDVVDFSEDESKPDTLFDYDMVIVGFEDAFPNVPSAAAIKALKAYGESGRSMLYTHDTTSWITNLSLSGMNSETSGRVFSSTKLYTSGWDSFASSFLSNDIRDMIGMDRFDYVGSTNISGKNYSTIHDVPLAANSSSSSGTVKVGVTYSSAATPSSQYRLLNNINNKRNEGCNLVSQTNDGAIASYPYAIPSSLSVAKTHSQYFQLNLDMDNDADEDSDITVWYTLDGATGASPRSVYHASPYDARNNYYIYNRGSITYSGVGHSSVTSTPQEMQLFINTMIASYNAGVRKPTIKIYDSTFSDEMDYDILPYDTDVASYVTSSSDTSTGAAQDQYYYIYFTPTDLNISTYEHWINYSFSIGFGSDSGYTGTYNTAKPITNYTSDYTLYSVSGTTLTPYTAARLESGGQYAVRISIKDLIDKGYFTENDNLDFYVVSTVSQIRDGTETQSAINYDKLSIMHQQLFDLD